MVGVLGSWVLFWTGHFEAHVLSHVVSAIFTMSPGVNAKSIKEQIWVWQKMLGHTLVVWGETQEHWDKEGEKLSFVKSFNP